MTVISCLALEKQIHETQSLYYTYDSIDIARGDFHFCYFAF